MLVDTHVHLNDEKYKEILDDVIINSVNNNACVFCVMGCDYKSSCDAIDIAKKYNNSSVNGKRIECYAFVGIYPGEILKDEYSSNHNELRWIEDLYLNNKDVVKGIGEIGIDLYWDKSLKNEQIEFFKAQLDISRKFNLPVSIHAREATQITLDILKEYKGEIKGVMHCYSGSIEIANELVKLGLKIGIGGVVTYKNSKLKDVVKLLDIKDIVTETDGPYLTPTPHRGELNIPAYIKYIIEEISSIKNLNCEKCEEILEGNARKVFGLF